MEIVHCLELVYNKNYSNIAKILVLRLFKMVANQRECFTLEQRYLIKFVVAEKCQQWGIHWKMCDVNGASCLSKKKMFSNGWTGIWFGGHYPKKRSIQWVHIDPAVKKKFLAQQSVKKVMFSVFWDMKWNITIYFLEKDTTVNIYIRGVFKKLPVIFRMDF